jgi:pyruvate dehydrogenase E1 component alpha subunit
MDSEFLIEMYRRLLRIRYFDEKVLELHSRAEFPGAAHASIGQEGEIVGACMALRQDDYMLGNHRSHGHPIGKGADLKGLMAELFGKVTGVNRGKGGSMHLADFSVGSLGETSIVASGIPVAAGAGLGAKMAGTDRVCLCFFGDGASNEGAFHEGLNLAAIWNLPVIYLCENNGYAVTTAFSTACAVENVADRAVAYGIPGTVVDGQDPLAVHEVVSEAVRRARAGAGPSLVEAKTYRYMGHAGGIGRMEESRREEREQWMKRDPLLIHRERLLAEGIVTADLASRIDAEVRTEVDDAVAFARESAFPERVELFDHLYTEAPAVATSSQP